MSDDAGILVREIAQAALDEARANFAERLAVAVEALKVARTWMSTEAMMLHAKEGFSISVTALYRDIEAVDIAIAQAGETEWPRPRSGLGAKPEHAVPSGARDAP